MKGPVFGLECMARQSSCNTENIATQSSEPFGTDVSLARPDRFKYTFANDKIRSMSRRDRLYEDLVAIRRRRNRSRNNSAAPTVRCVPRYVGGRNLPPLKNHKDIVKTETTTEDSTDGAICPTDYFKRLREKLSDRSAVNCSLNVPKDSPCTDDPKQSIQSGKPVKLSPVQSKTKTTPLLSNAKPVKQSKIMKNQSNLSSSMDGPSKRKVSMFNMKNVSGDLISPTVVTVVKDDVPSMASTSVKLAETIVNMTAEKSNSDSTRQTVRSKIAEDWDETSHRDRYLSVMEEMLKKHKGLSTRTTRSPATPGSNSGGPAVPGRRIQALTTVPEDPMMRLTGRHVFHSMGFKMPEKSDSMVVEPDHQQIRQVSILQECEQKLMDSDTLKCSQVYPTPIRTEIATSLQTGVPEVPSLTSQRNSKTESDLGSLDQYSLEPIGSDTESTISTAEPDELESELGHSTIPPQIDSSRVYFHFNPVVQIYPNQTPWRSRSKISRQKESRNLESDVMRREEELNKLTETDPTAVVGEDNPPNRRPHSVDPILIRQFSIGNSLEMRQAMRSFQQKRSSSSTSSLSDCQTFSSISEMTNLDDYLGRIRRVKSASPTALASTTQVTCLSADEGTVTRLGAVHMDRSIITHDAQHHPHVSLSIHDKTTAAGLVPSTCVSKPMTIFDVIADRKSLIPERRERARRLSKSQIPDPCLDVLMAATDPNPMTWFDILEERVSNCTRRLTIQEKLIAQFRLKGLQKRFVAIPRGLLGLQRELEKGWDIRPKPEMLLSCLVKHHVLKMPMNTPQPALMEKIYTNSIVRYPVLYKMIMRRREILPQELQQFLNRIMELTETSDRMMASITTCTSKLTTVTTAAREMDASGFMTGGPKLKQNYDSDLRNSWSSRARSQRFSQNSRSGLPMASDKSTFFTENADSSVKHTTATVSTTTTTTTKKDTGFFPLYGKETEFDKEFYTVLRNPCANILEEVALHIPEFAWHVRPLFEHRWATLEDDLFEKMLEQGAIPTETTTEQETTVPVDSKSQTIGGETCGTTQPTTGSSLRGMLLRWPETYTFCERLFHRVLTRFAHMDPHRAGNAMLSDLLICIHMTNYSKKLGDLLVKELDQWIPPLLAELESNYAFNREDSCCVLSYLVCSYRLITRLHAVSKNLLVANISFAVLSAIGHYPENYAFYHGLLGYMLHALPCLSTLDCLLLWLPSVQHNETNLVARDWGLLVYYVLRHWPRNPFYLDTMYQKKLLKPLEASYLTKYAKRGARLALSYLVRTCNVRSALLVCWPESEEDTVALD